MTELEYIKSQCESLHYNVATDGRRAKGVVVTVLGFAPVKLYGQRVRVTTWSISATYIGASVLDGTCFDELEKLNEAIHADKTAGGIAEDVEVSAWTLRESEKGLATFNATITVRR